MNMVVNGIEYDNTFLVVRGLNLDMIIGNDFLKRCRAVVDFDNQVIGFSHESGKVSVSFERMLKDIEIAGLRIMREQYHVQVKRE